MLAWQVVAVACFALGANDTMLLDFTATWCGPCRQMQPVVASLAQQGVPVRAVDIDQHPELAQQFRVTGVPTFVLVANGHEQGRIEGATTAEQLLALWARAGGAPGHAPFGNPSAFPVAAAGHPLGPAAAEAPAQWSSHSDVGPAPGPAQAGAVPVGNLAAPTDGAATGLLATDEVARRLLTAAVRIKVDDARGHSYGTGTIITSSPQQALILTCGHIFRESQGQGQIAVDLFAPGAPATVPGQLVSYNLERDLAVVQIAPGCVLPAVPVAPPELAAAVGDTVISLGCDHGSDPTAWRSRVTAVDKYLGSPNLEVAGLPIEGRSGGGLVSAQGYVIGVCNAADPEDQEGLFAASGSIHQQLDACNLAALYQHPAASQAAGAQLAAAAIDSAMPATASAVPAPSAVPPAMPASMPLAPFGSGGVASTSGQTQTPALATIAADAPAGLSARERATLDALRHARAGAEVVCVIRSLTDPRAKSEIIVLDRASPEFLEQLATEDRIQQARHLTAARSPIAPRTAVRESPWRPASWQR